MLVPRRLIAGSFLACKLVFSLAGDLSGVRSIRFGPLPILSISARERWNLRKFRPVERFIIGAFGDARDRGSPCPRRNL